VADDELLHPVLRNRFSPLRFDAGHTVRDREVALLLEAARWAPSAGNSQPWAFFLARRGTPEHDLVVGHLAASARRWVPDAALLVVNLVHRQVEGTDWPYSEFADYDVGQAVAHMTLQAHALGLACRQFRAFDLEALTRSLDVQDGWAVLTITAIGRSDADAPATRDRRDLASLVAEGRAQ
jgi:nitroreductase